MRSRFCAIKLRAPFRRHLRVLACPCHLYKKLRESCLTWIHRPCQTRTWQKKDLDQSKLPLLPLGSLGPTRPLRFRHSHLQLRKDSAHTSFTRQQCHPFPGPSMPATLSVLLLHPPSVDPGQACRSPRLDPAEHLSQAMLRPSRRVSSCCTTCKLASRLLMTNWAQKCPKVGMFLLRCLFKRPNAQYQVPLLSQCLHTPRRRRIRASWLFKSKIRRIRRRWDRTSRRFSAPMAG